MKTIDIYFDGELIRQINVSDTTNGDDVVAAIGWTANRLHAEVGPSVDGVIEARRLEDRWNSLLLLVADANGIDVANIVGSYQKRPAPLIRAVLCDVWMQHTKASCNSTAKRVGRDNSTLRSGIREFKNQLPIYPEVRRIYDHALLACKAIISNTP